MSKTMHGCSPYLVLQAVGLVTKSLRRHNLWVECSEQHSWRVRDNPIWAVLQAFAALKHCSLLYVHRVCVSVCVGPAGQSLLIPDT